MSRFVCACHSYPESLCPENEMSDQPEALRLADRLEGRWALHPEMQEAAAELRRLAAAEADFHMAYRMKCDAETKRLQAERDAAISNRQYTCEPHKDRVKEGGPCVWCERDAAVMKLIAVGHALQGDFGETHPSFRSLELEDAIRLRAERDAAVAVLEAVLKIPDMSDADLEQLRINCKAAIDAARSEK